MKAGNFRYIRPVSLAHACQVLADAGGEAAAIAFGAKDALARAQTVGSDPQRTRA
jgi:hypothetical protein